MTTTPNRTVKRCGCRRYRRRDNRRTEHLGGLAGGPSFAPRHGQRDNRRSRPAPLRSGSCRLATTQPRPIRCAQEPLAWPLATERRNRCVQEALACGDGQPGAPSTGEPNRVGDAGIAGTSRLSATDPGDSARGRNVSPERNRSGRFGARHVERRVAAGEMFLASTHGRSACAHNHGSRDVGSTNQCDGRGAARSASCGSRPASRRRASLPG
jgi:hypothetical protein